MSKAAALATVPESAPSPSALDALKADRASLSTEVSRLSGIRERLLAAEAGERESTAAIGELGRAEVAVLTEWASAGAAGEPPHPDMKQRTKLAATLAQAQAIAAAARSAGGNIDAQLAGTQRRLAELDQAIEQAAINALADQFELELAALVRFSVEVQNRSALVFGGVRFLADRGQHLQAGGAIEAATRIFRVIERLAQLPKPVFEPTNGQVQSAATSWADRFSELLD